MKGHPINKKVLKEGSEELLKLRLNQIGELVLHREVLQGDIPKIIDAIQKYKIANDIVREVEACPENLENYSKEYEDYTNLIVKKNKK